MCFRSSTHVQAPVIMRPPTASCQACQLGMVPAALPPPPPLPQAQHSTPSWRSSLGQSGHAEVLSSAEACEALTGPCWQVETQQSSFNLGAHTPLMQAMSTDEVLASVQSPFALQAHQPAQVTACQSPGVRASILGILE